MIPGLNDPATIQRAEAFWTDSLNLWQRFLDPKAPAADDGKHARDKRFAAPQWRDNPLFDWIRQSYFLISDHMLANIDAMAGVDERQKEQLRFAARGFLEAMSPSNFPATNPVVLEKTIETGGENLLKGLQNMLADLAKGQLTHTDPNAFELGRNLATTPGKVVKRTPLYELIQYSPTTEKVLGGAAGDLPALDQPLLHPRPDAGEKLHPLGGRPGHHGLHGLVEIGRCRHGRCGVGRLCRGADRRDRHGARGAEGRFGPHHRLLRRRHHARRDAGGAGRAGCGGQGEERDLLHGPGRFLACRRIAQLRRRRAAENDRHLSPEGILDGRYLALTFNLLRGRDLIWNYVTNNYLLGQDYAPFDLLHWNGDTTNLPAKWHMSYLTDLYRDNLLVKPGHALQSAARRST